MAGSGGGTSVVGRDGPVALRVLVAAVVGVAAGVAAGLTSGWRYAPVAGWTVAASVFLVWTWVLVGRMTPAETSTHATREDPTGHTTSVIVTLASVASLAGVAYLLVAAQAKGGTADLDAALGVASVVASWLVVHTVFTLRYAKLYYSGTPGGVDFNQDEPPAFVDFAYLAFTLGMTYQVSDTDLKTPAIRHSALRQALLSYLLGAIILAVTINLVASLGSSSN